MLRRPWGCAWVAEQHSKACGAAMAGPLHCRVRAARRNMKDQDARDASIPAKTEPRVCISAASRTCVARTG